MSSRTRLSPNENLYPITAVRDDGARVTFQIEATDVSAAVGHWAKRYSPGAADARVELIGSEVRDLPTPVHDTLIVTPMEGLRHVWYFYGVADSQMITGNIVFTA